MRKVEIWQKAWLVSMLMRRYLRWRIRTVAARPVFRRVECFNSHSILRWDITSYLRHLLIDSKGKCMKSSASKSEKGKNQSAKWSFNRKKWTATLSQSTSGQTSCFITPQISTDCLLRNNTYVTLKIWSMKLFWSRACRTHWNGRMCGAMMHSFSN